MRFRQAVAAFIMILALTPTWAIGAEGVPAQISTPRSELTGDCNETSVQPTSLPNRPVLHRLTHSSRPRRHRRHHASRPKRAVAHHTHPRHRARHRRHHLARHRPHSGTKRIALHRLSYPSPLCAKRSHLINALIGLPDQDYAVTQPPIPPEETTQIGDITTLPPLWPTPGGGTVDYPIIFFPYTPIFPPGPGPILLPPVPPLPPLAPPPLPLAELAPAPPLEPAAPPLTSRVPATFINGL